MKKIRILLLAMSMVLIVFSGCSSAEIEGENDEKIVLTALYWKDFPEFEALVEATYPEIDLQLERSTSAVYSSDIQRRLQNGHGTDIVFNSLPNSDIREYMLDLSGYNFSNRFASATMEIIRNESKTFFLPMPSLYRGIIINKTLLSESGLEIPTTQQELLEVLGAVKEAGIGVNSEGYCFAMEQLDGTAMGDWVMSLSVPDFLGTMDGEQWANAFINKTAAAHGTLEKYLQFPIQLTELGYMDASRIHVFTMSKNSTDVVANMSDREMTACYASSGALYDIRQRNREDEFVMLSLLSNNGNHEWVITTPESYIGINAALKTDEKKLDAALKVMDIFATVEGQAAILQDTNTDASYLNKEVTVARENITGLESYVEQGYVYNINRFDSHILWLIGKNIAAVCNGEMTLEEAMISVDALNRGEPLSEKDDYTLIGSVQEDLLYENYNTRLEETALGNLIADAVREQTGSDFAFTNGGGIRASLYKGDVYVSDLAQVSPYDNRLTVVEVKGNVIYEMLENSISAMYYQEVPGGRFLQVSGLCYSFSIDKSTEIKAADALNGTRVPCTTRLLSVTLPDGTELKRDALYTITVTDYMAGISGYESAGDGFTMLNVLDDASAKAEGVSLVELRKDTAREALIAYFRNHKNENIISKVENRITIEVTE